MHPEARVARDPGAPAARPEARQPEAHPNPDADRHGGGAPPAPPRHAVVFYADAGGGHRATATALAEILEATGRYRVTLFNPYRELIPHLDLTRRLTGMSGERVYNHAILRQGRTGLTCWLFYAVLKANYLLFGRTTVRLLRDRLARLDPDIVVSVMPLANSVIARALARRDGSTRIPFAILMTDWTEIARGVWFPPRRRYHAICGTPEALTQARRNPALARAQVHRMDGLLVGPRFSGGARPRGLALDPARPLVTVLYGAHGSARMRAVAAALAEPASGCLPSTQVVFLCGHDDTLAETLRAMSLPFDARVVGFTDRVADYLAASDLFVGKPGPGSVSEALALNVPVLLDRAAALPQEMAVLAHVRDHGLGRVFSTMAELRAACAQMLGERAARPAPRANRAAAQIAGILTGLCDDAEAGPDAPARRR